MESWILFSFAALLAFGLGMLILKKMWPTMALPANAPSEFEQQDHYFQSSHGSIFYSCHGDKKKPCLVLLHGIGGSSYNWRLLIPLLEQDFHLINMDLWGFGRSAKAPQIPATLEVHQTVVQELLAELQIKRYSLVGCSMGAALALWFCAERLLPIERIVVLAPAAAKGLVPRVTRGLGWVSHLTPALMNRSFIRRILKKIYAPGTAVDEQTVEAYLRPYKEKASHRTFSNHLRMLQDSRLTESLEKLNVPILLLYGKGDRIVPAKVAQSIARRIPKVLVQEHPVAGHHLMEEDPGWCAQYIRDFFADSSSGE